MPFRSVRFLNLLLFFGFLATSRMSWAAASPPVQLPVEVIGTTGTTQTVTVDVPADQTANISSLWMQVHGLSYPNKASVQINNADWVALNNTTVIVAEPGKSYGGIGGAFATLKVTLPLSKGTVVAGANTLRFRFNGTDGISAGYRVLAFNFLTAAGNRVLPPGAFVQDDPNRWQPPLNDAADIAAGQTLWHTATLSRSPLDGSLMTAHCSDCHAQDGRDLKYFNYSNLSIIARAKFHGLSEQQGQQIASYIRSLNMPHPGRPWNPPYQPGPGLDSQPIQNWSAGAGVDAVLDHDHDMLSYLFPNGITAQAVPITGTLNMRELPIALQLPDWNHWLPRVFPGDSFGTAFTNSAFVKMYNGTNENDPHLFTLRTHMADPKYRSWPGVGVALDELNAWMVQKLNFLNPYVTGPSISWSPDYSEKIYSVAQWMTVKTWEMIHEFNLEGYGPTYYKTYGEPRTWENASPFRTGPHELQILAGPNGLEGSALLTDYIDNQWYYVQMVVNAGNHHQQGADTIDWQYTYGLFKDLSLSSGNPDALRMVAYMIKGMQNTTNGIGPESPEAGWNPLGAADVSLLAHPEWDGLWSDISPSERASIDNAVLTNWLARCKQYAPQQYYTGGLAHPDDVPTGNFFSGLWVDRVWVMIPRFRQLGADNTLLNNLCDWAATLWPKADWASLKR